MYAGEINYGFIHNIICKYIHFLLFCNIRCTQLLFNIQILMFVTLAFIVILSEVIAFIAVVVIDHYFLIHDNCNHYSIILITIATLTATSTKAVSKPPVVHPPIQVHETNCEYVRTAESTGASI